MSKTIQTPICRLVWANLNAYFTQTQVNYHKARIIVAYSGGKDSHVLLHILSEIQSQYSHSILLEAWHVHHGLSLNAGIWRKHCQNICQNLNIRFKDFTVQIDQKSKHSLEELARNARYQIFKKNMQPDDILLTAHTQNDQAETVLMHLSRGSGLLGLSGIPNAANWDKGQLFRPMLDINRDAISEYADSKQLDWIEDESNQDTRFLRNTMRHQILPQLKERNPSIIKNLARSARLCSDSNILLNEYLAPELEQIQITYNQINLVLLKQKNPRQVRALLRLWFQKNNYSLPSEKKLNEIITQMLYAKSDRCPEVHWGGYQIRRYQNVLSLSLQEVEKTDNIKLEQRLWDLSKPFRIHNSDWMAKPVLGQGIKIAGAKSTLEVRFRSSGERCRIFGENLSRKLKHVLQDLKIPPWERVDTPLFYLDDYLVAVGEHIVSERCKNLEPQAFGWVLSKARAG